MSAAKRKGTAWETALVNYFKENGLPSARRVAQQGREDLGDIHGISPFIGQAKNYRSIVDGLNEGVKGANDQRIRAGEDFGVALVKRPGKGVAQGYAVMTVEQFTDLLVRLKQAEENT